MHCSVPDIQFCEIFKQITLFFPSTVSPIVPSNYIYPSAETLSVNGSSQDGRCSSTPYFINKCEDPTRSVLFDGNIPTLDGLNGSMWASELLTVQIRQPSGIEIISNFAGSSGVERVELVMFNCPEWGIAVQAIGIRRATSISSTRTPIGAIIPTITSCNSLVRVCISSLAITDLQVIYLQFIPAPDSNRTYLAEVEFYQDNATCQQDAIIATPLRPDTTTPPPPDTTTPDITTPRPPDTAPPDTTQEKVVQECKVCPSCSTSAVLASVITVITTALLTTAISVLVMITVFKCHPKFTPETAEGEGQEYEEVDGGKGGVAVSDPTYMEVGERRGGNTFQLRENEAYSSTIRK